MGKSLKDIEKEFFEQYKQETSKGKNKILKKPPAKKKVIKTSPTQDKDIKEILAKNKDTREIPIQDKDIKETLAKDKITKKIPAKDRAIKKPPAGEKLILALTITFYMSIIGACLSIIVFMQWNTGVAVGIYDALGRYSEVALLVFLSLILGSFALRFQINRQKNKS